MHSYMTLDLQLGLKAEVLELIFDWGCSVSLARLGMFFGCPYSNAYVSPVQSEIPYL